MAIPVTCALPVFLLAALAPQMSDDFSFGARALGLTIALHYGACALCSVRAGRIVAAIGLVGALRAAGLIAATACVLMALAARSAVAVIVIMLFAALSNGLAAPVAGGVLSGTTVRQGLAFGAQQAGGPLAPLLAGLALPLVVTPLGWRWAFAIAAALALAIAITRPPSPPAAVPAAGAPGIGRAERASVLWLATSAGLAGAAAMGAASFLVTYAVGDVGMSSDAAGLVLAALGVTAAAGRVFFGALADRRGADPLLSVVAMLGVSVCGYVMLIAGTPGALFVAAVVIGFAGWGWAGALAVALVRMLSDAPSAVGAMMAGTFAGAVTGSVVIGALAEHERWALAWALCAGMAAAAAILVTIARRALGPRTSAGARPVESRCS